MTIHADALPLEVPRGRVVLRALPGQSGGKCYVYLPRQEGDRVATTERLDAAILVDRAADGRVIGIEIVDPSQCGPDRLMDVLRSLGQAEVDRDEFRPLAAA